MAHRSDAMIMPGHARPFSKAIGLMLVASLALALMSVQVKTLSVQLGVHEIVFLRSLMHLVLLVPILLGLRVPLARDFKPVLILRGALGYLGVLCFFYSLRSLPVAFAILIAWTSPLFTVLASMVLLRERLSASVAAALLITLGGLYVFLSPGQATQLPQLRLLLIAFGGAICAGVSYAVLKKTDPRTSPHSVAFYFSGFALLACILRLPGHFEPPRSELWLAILVLGGGAAVYQYSVARAYQIAPALKVAPLSLLTPLLGGLLDRIWCGQVLAMHQLWGGALMLAGIGLIHCRAMLVSAARE
ncbi:MAG: DMT family transporter [Deltaproteobacteria bacterium]|nr:DMT family transporter [Deltaproteobacteria bacterium]